MDFAITLLWLNWTMSHRGGRVPSLGDATTGRGAATRATTGEGEHCPRAATGEGERRPRATAGEGHRRSGRHMGGAPPLEPPQGRKGVTVGYGGRDEGCHLVLVVSKAEGTAT
jgi:hypothetical protein